MEQCVAANWHDGMDDVTREYSIWQPYWKREVPSEQGGGGGDDPRELGTHPLFVIPGFRTPLPPTSRDLPTPLLV